MRIFFVGDELIAGYGDARRLGWTGRVLARTADEPPIMSFIMPMPGEDTAGLSQRWISDVTPRIDPEDDNRLVIGLGSHDLDTGQSTARTRLYLANILDGAARLKLKTFVVGPPPRRDHTDREQSELTRAFHDACSRREIPYVDTFTPLARHEQWATDLTLSGSYEPRQTGYGLLAWLVLHNGWNSWLGVAAPEE